MLPNTWPNPPVAKVRRFSSPATRAMKEKDESKCKYGGYIVRPTEFTTDDRSRNIEEG